MTRRGGTDGSLLATLPWTLAALGLAIAPHVPYQPPWITLALLACAGARWLIERRRWRLPPASLRIALAVGCFLGVFASFKSISGVGPGSALLAIMAALKLLETRQRRDQYVLLFISIFLIMSALLREQYVWSLPYLVAGVTLTMSAWLRMSASGTLGAAPALRIAGRLILYAAPLTAAMWILFPRLATPFWSVPVDTGTATTGLSEEMSPGDISTLSTSDAVAFRVTFESAVPAPERRYWRGLVLSRFDGRRWSGDDPIEDPRSRRGLDARGKPVRYRVTLEPTRQRWIFALDMPYEWNLDGAFMTVQQGLARRRPVDQRVAYEALSYPDYRNEPILSRAARNSYLPAGTNPRTADLAFRMRQEAGSDEAYIDTVLRMFHDRDFYYTLDPPPLGRNPVDEFLFDTRRGFCEHYASAFAVMMRAAGIPARIVLGYQGGEMNRIGDYMIVRQSDAHAWVEVWLPGRGWVRRDPTAAVAPERIEAGMSGARFDDVGARWGLHAPARWLYRLEMSWDALNARWNEWILGYGPENQARFMEWLGMEHPGWRKLMLTLMAAVGILLGGTSLLMLRRYRPPPRDPAAKLYRRFTRKVGVRPETGETAEAYARRIASLGLALPRESNRIARAYLAARYGRPSPRSVAALAAAVASFRSRD